MSEIPSWLSVVAPKLDEFLRNSPNLADSLRHALIALIALNAAMLIVLIYIAWRLS